MVSFFSISVLNCMMVFSFCFLSSLFWSKNIGTVMKKFLVCDKISFVLCLLVLWICLLMMLSQPENLKNWGKFLVIKNFFMCIILCLCFLVFDFFWFFVFFEFSLIPVMMLVIGWGIQPERLNASFYLMSYTILGSLPLFANLLIFFSADFSLKIFFWKYMMEDLYFEIFFELWEYGMIFFFFMFGFFVKLPVYGLHIWLTKAHVEAPVVGSMILAGVLLKLGAYGMFRLLLMWSFLEVFWVNLLGLWILVSLSLVSFMCFRQKDLKSLIAYSSVIHMMVVLSGMLIMKVVSFYGLILMLIAHGLCSSGLFWMVKVFYENSGSRKIFYNRGLLYMFPVLSMFWLSFCLINSSLPPSLKFFSEVFLFSSIFINKNFNLLFIIFSVFLGGLFKIYLYLVVMHWKWKNIMNLWSALNFRYMLICALHFFSSMFLIFFMKVLF